MALPCARAIVALLMINGAGAAFVRGSSLAVHQLQANEISSGVSQKRAIDWTTVGIGAGIGALVAGAIIGGLAFAKRSKEDSQEDGGEMDEKAEPLLAQEEASSATDYAELLQSLSKKMAEEVGPKFEKGGAVREVLESRASSFTDKAKNFLLSEMNGMSGAVMREMEAEESMLLLDWNHAVEANFPPAPIIMAGVLSPTVINIMSFHHFVQTITVGFPLFVLCVFAVYTDWGAPCAAIPTLFAWLYTQTVLAFCIFFGHAALLSQLSSGRKKLAAKKAEIEENLKGSEEGGFSNLKEQFIGNTIILQEALLIENAVRHSVWNTVVGLATFIFLLTTIWNLVLVVGWTFVPGVVAFHPDAQKVAGDDFCGAWATVLVLKISMLLSVLYFFLNLATVIQWFCDMLVESKGFTDTVLAKARKADKETGLPIVELLAKAFLLRGGDDSLISRLSVVQHHKKSLQSKQADLESQLAALNGKIGGATQAEEALQVKAKDGGDLAAAVHKLNSNTIDYESWKKQGATAIEEAELKAVEIGAASTDALEKLYEKINAMIEEVSNSDTVKAAVAAAQEAEKYAEQRLHDAYDAANDMYNDPEFQAKVRELADKASAQVEVLGAQAKNLANDAIAMASDPELQKQLQEAAQNAMAQAQAAAEQAQAAVNDPELQKKLKEAMDMAEAKAQEAAAGITDPELQKKMKETAQRTLEQVQAGAESAAAALVDPEVQKKLQDTALAAMAEARAAADKAAAAATDPKLKEAALKQLKDAQAAAERAAAVAQDPETRKKFEEAAQRAMEQAKTVANEKVEEASVAAQKGVAQAKQQGEKASAAAQKGLEQAKEQGEKAKEVVEEAAAKAKGKKGKK